MYPIEKNKAHRMFACFCVTPTMLRSILNKNIKEYKEQVTSRTVIISIAKFLPVNIKSNSFNLAKGHIIKINKGCLNNGVMCHRTVWIYIYSSKPETLKSMFRSPHVYLKWYRLITFSNIIKAKAKSVGIRSSCRIPNIYLIFSNITLITSVLPNSTLIIS